MLGVLANGTSRPASCYLPWERNVWTETRGLVDGSEVKLWGRMTIEKERKL